MHLYIIGDGPDRLKIEKQIEKLHLSDDVSLLGNQSNPFPYLRKMDAFVLDSRYEGQGIVLLEAKALGLKLIFPTRLEKYNEGLIGSESIVDVLCTVQKSVKIVDDLQFYNTDILKKLDLLLN